MFVCAVELKALLIGLLYVSLFAHLQPSASVFGQHLFSFVVWTAVLGFEHSTSQVDRTQKNAVQLRHCFIRGVYGNNLAQPDRLNDVDALYGISVDLVPSTETETGPTKQQLSVECPASSVVTGKSELTCPSLFWPTILHWLQAESQLRHSQQIAWSFVLLTFL